VTYNDQKFLDPFIRDSMLLSILISMIKSSLSQHSKHVLL
jgi:hypothetical protein